LSRVLFVVGIVDRSLHRVRESRALAIQPRMLEALAGFGVTDELVKRRNPAVRLRMHLPGRVVQIPLFSGELTDPRTPSSCCSRRPRPRASSLNTWARRE
jgi:2-polyprenyl-6-methoxyphenol hydroxylase-like FAD-dependent oxidoreductase